jgi:hypothetical protein
VSTYTRVRTAPPSAVLDPCLCGTTYAVEGIEATLCRRRDLNACEGGVTVGRAIRCVWRMRERLTTGGFTGMADTPG